MRPIVILESPYTGDVKRNTLYARRAMLDSIHRGEAPMVSHLLYTQVLDDNIQESRAIGIDCGLSWIIAAHKTVVYGDYGTTPGMEYGISIAISLGMPVDVRSIGPNPPDELYNGF